MTAFNVRRSTRGSTTEVGRGTWPGQLIRVAYAMLHICDLKYGGVSHNSEMIAWMT